jgi:hypothetical protein
MAELRELVVAGPDPEKHQVVRWRCADVRVEVTRRFSVTVPERTIGKWLRKLELTPAAAAPVSSQEGRGRRWYETTATTPHTCLARSAPRAAWASR